MHPTLRSTRNFVSPVLSPYTSPSDYAGALLLFGGVVRRCPKGLDQTLSHLFRNIASLASGKRLVLAGFSNGATLAQWYVANQVQPAPDKLVLISQPTNDVWARKLALKWPNCNGASHWELLGPLYPKGRRSGITHERGVIADFITNAFSEKREAARAREEERLPSPLTPTRASRRPHGEGRWSRERVCERARAVVFSPPSSSLHPRLLTSRHHASSPPQGL